MTGLPNAIEPAPIEGTDADRETPTMSASERDHRLAIQRVRASIERREALIAEIRRTLPK